LRQVLSYGAHPPRELRDRLRGRIVFQVPQHLMPVLDRRHVTQRDPEEGHQVVLLPAGRHLAEYLVKVQVREEGRFRALAGLDGFAEQNADKRHEKLTRTSTGSLIRQKPSAKAAVSGGLHHLRRLYPRYRRGRDHSGSGYPGPILRASGDNGHRLRRGLPTARHDWRGPDRNAGRGAPRIALLAPCVSGSKEIPVKSSITR
jgi:hypothetical protein